MTYVKHTRYYGFNMTILSCCAVVFVTIVAEYGNIVLGYPVTTVNLFPEMNKLEDKSISGVDSAEQSFRHFIHSKPESTVIGELKPNSSSLELMLFKDKIASAIMSMQEMERVQNTRSQESSNVDCFIETTKVERIPGKCHKVNNGLPICQSSNYMAINMDCS